jgi:NADH:ubiquinone oxidoreductase subunit H
MVALKAFLVVVGLLTAFAFMTLIERRLLARFQIRMGPNRVGPFGLFQPIADAIKSIFKEDLVVERADKVPSSGWSSPSWPSGPSPSARLGAFSASTPGW